MGLRRFLVVTAVLVAAVAYWGYSPLPPGYSTSTRMQFHIANSVWKFTDIVSCIGSYLGFGTEVQLFRDIMGFLVKQQQAIAIEGVVSRDTIFDGVPVRIYKPSGVLNETLPGVVYFHGGGWTYGNIDTVDAISRQLCKDTKTVVVSVEYRLAPEFPFPASFDDSVIATKYLMKNAADLNVDPKRIALAGDSAGGNLAATVSLKLRDEKYPIRPKLQVAIYPAFQGLDFNLPSYLQNKDGPFLTRSMMVFFTAMYIDGNYDHTNVYLQNRHVPKSFRQKIAKTYMNLEKLPKEFLSGYVAPDFPDGDEKVWNKIKGNMLNPYYSPLAADNLEDLPEAYIFTVNFDPLRDEAWLYGIRLREAKNKVTLYNAENGFHPFATFVGAFPESDAMFAKVTKFIADKL